MTGLRILRNAMHLGYVDFRYQWSPATWLGGWCVRVLAQTTFFALIGQLLGSPLKVEYLLIGNSIMVGCEAALLAVQATTWERFDGTYPLLVVAPASMLPSVVGRTSAWLIDGMATAVIAFYTAALIFRLPLTPVLALEVLPLILLTCISAYCLALFLGALVSLKPSLRNMVSQVMRLSMMAICGVNVPVTFWPLAVQVTANVLPVTHGVQAVRLALSGAPPAAVLTSALLELVVAAGWLLVALVSFNGIAERGRTDGSIELV